MARRPHGVPPLHRHDTRRVWLIESLPLREIISISYVRNYTCRLVTAEL